MTKNIPNPPVAKDPLLACFLSFIFGGGGGQMYLGQVKKGVSLTVSTLTILFVGFVYDPNMTTVAGMIGLTSIWVITIVGTIDAYKIAKRIQENGRVKEWEFFWDSGVKEKHEIIQDKTSVERLVNIQESRANIKSSVSRIQKTTTGFGKQKRTLQAFLCHSSGDKSKVEKYYNRLINDGIEAWLDKKNILPGERWQIEIPKAVRNSDVVIVFLTSQSITKEGFVQKEIKIALDTADEKPEGAIFIIPARLENCEVPERLSAYQWVDLFEEDGYERLMMSLQARAGSLNIKVN